MLYNTVIEVIFVSVLFVKGECFSNSVEYLDTQSLTWHKPRVTVSILKIELD